MPKRHVWEGTIFVGPGTKSVALIPSDSEVGVSWLTREIEKAGLHRKYARVTIEELSVPEEEIARDESKEADANG